METIAILCDRVRIEEKQIQESLGRLNLPCSPVAPLAFPVAVGSSADGSGPFADMRAVIDRCANRSGAIHLNALLRDQGKTVLGAGLASAGTRMDVARRLHACGIPRPLTHFIGSESAGLEAVRQLGFPASLAPLSLAKSLMPLLDNDIAEAVLEHRDTLGSVSLHSMLLQQGAPTVGEVVDVIVVDGHVVGVSDTGQPALHSAENLDIATAAARALGAEIIGIRLAMIGSSVVVWDVQPVPEFRSFKPVTTTSVAGAIAQIAARATASPVEQPDSPVTQHSTNSHKAVFQELARGVVLSA